MKAAEKEPKEQNSIPPGIMLVGVCFGLCLRPVSALLGFLFPRPSAYGLAVFLIGLSIYPFIVRKNPLRASWLRRHAFLKWVLLYLALGVVSFLLDLAFPD